MADRSYGTIEIYGMILTRADLNQILKAVEVQGASIERYGKGDMESNVIAEILEIAGQKGASLDFYDEEAAGGELEHIACACRKIGLPYVMKWDACGGAYDAGVRSYRAGTSEEFSAVDGAPMISLGEINAILSTSRPIISLRQVALRMNRAIGGDFPPLNISDELRTELMEEAG